MKKYIKCIHLSAFAAAIALGGPLSASGTAPEGTTRRDQQPDHTTARTSDADVTTNSSMFTDSSKPIDTNVSTDTRVSTDATVSTEAKASTDRNASNNRKASGARNQSTTRVSSNPMTASSVLGMNIDTATNEKIGEIDEIFINSNTGEVVALVVSTGGFVGMGQNQTLISPQDLRFNGDRTRMHGDLSKEQIKNAPRYNKDNRAALSQVRPLGNHATGMTKRMNRTAQTEQSNRLDRVQSQGHTVSVSELIGMSVKNHQGETIGTVDEVFLDLENGEVAGVVVSTGGFLSMGDRKTLFGLREMAFDHANEEVILGYSREQIGAFPEYKANGQSDFIGLHERMDSFVANSNSANPGDTVRTEARKNRHANNANSSDAVRTAARNTARSSDMTVFDQGNSSAEIAMTASIRTAIRKDNTLSSRANNVTIITKDGKVLIRGDVDSAAEKSTVESIAQNKAGGQNVTSELIVRAH